VIGEPPLESDPAMCTLLAPSAAVLVAARISAGDLDATPLPDEPPHPPRTPASAIVTRSATTSGATRARAPAREGSTDPAYSRRRPNGAFGRREFRVGELGVTTYIDGRRTKRGENAVSLCDESAHARLQPDDRDANCDMGSGRETAFADMTGAIQHSSKLRRGRAHADPRRRAEARVTTAEPRSGGDGARSAPVRWAPAGTVALALAAGAGVVLASSVLSAAVCAALLAAAAAAAGWLAGERRRAKLRREIVDRSLELRKTMTELEIAQAETVRRLSMAVEFRDKATGAHIERSGLFSRLLAEQIGLDSELCERISYAAPLHDVGKVAIPDAILLKPGRLTAEERAIVETHAEEGHRLLKGSSSAILEMAATIALSHHEKWDGSGYPRGLAGEAIPIEGRIVAIADVFDALTSARVYRKALSVGDAVRMMREERARHFDPLLLDAFDEVLEQSRPDGGVLARIDRTSEQIEESVRSAVVG
jgi:HD-GYP domain-containing protein (c-di-GMP phosphodiesterase class II)